METWLLLVPAAVALCVWAVLQYRQWRYDEAWRHAVDEYQPVVRALHGSGDEILIIW